MVNASEERPPIIETARLKLVVLLPSEIEALIEGDPARAGDLAGVTFPDGWPHNVEAMQGLTWHLRHLREGAAQRAWRIRVIVERHTGIVVGSINLKGPPDSRGDVEIGWGLNEDRRGLGYAFEAAEAVLSWAAGQTGVQLFTATIPADNVPSQALARKLGMSRTGESRRALPVWSRPADSSM